MAKTDPEINQGHLLHNIVLFGRLLRRLDIDVTPTHLINLVKAMKYLDLSQHQDVQNASRTILINHHQLQSLYETTLPHLTRTPSNSRSFFLTGNPPLNPTSKPLHPMTR